jgi:molecular chaperone GrpE
MENLRARTARQSETERRFAVQGLAKDLLDVADNMDRCLGALPAEARAAAEAGQQPAGADASGVALHQLSVGLAMTSRVLAKSLAKHGVVRFDPEPGCALDPHAMHALFQLPCPPGREKGAVAVVSKPGYKLHDRVIRPAEVGVFA